MTIKYKTKKLEKQLTDLKELKKKYGTLALTVNLRIKQLTNSDTLKVLGTIQAANCHELSGNLKGSLAVDVSKSYRIIFEPNHEPIPKKADGGLDWSEVTNILITDVLDYH